MTQVKWIKICTDIFDDEKILLIESIPEADSIIVIWFKLLCLAGKQNNKGVFMLNDKIAYTDEMLSSIFRRPLNTVRMALKTFETYEMIEIVDNVITIPNWDKHQSLDALEKKKEYDRQYQANKRLQQKLLIEEKNRTISYDDSTTVVVLDKEKEEDKELDKELINEIENDNDNERIVPRIVPRIVEEEKEEEPTPKQVIDLYHEICTSLPKVVKLTDSRKKSINARFKEGITLEMFREVFTKAQNSSFLTGNNDRGFKADIDFLINANSLTKTLEGKYDNRVNANIKHRDIKNDSKYKGEMF